MSDFAKCKALAQDAANRTGIRSCILNFSRFSPLYVIRTYHDGMENREDFVCFVEVLS